MNKVKGSLYPSERETELYRTYFVEGANLQGRVGLLHQVDTTKNINTDSSYTYLQAVEVSYYLVDRPKLKQLQRFGWNPEDKEHMPIICYLTFKDIKGNDILPSEGAVLEVSSRVQPHLKEYASKKFDIVGVQVDFEMNMFICNLVPHRERLKPAQPLPTPGDPINEIRWFTEKVNYPENPEEDKYFTPVESEVENEGN